MKTWEAIKHLEEKPKDVLAILDKQRKVKQLMLIDEWGNVVISNETPVFYETTLYKEWDWVVVVWVEDGWRVAE